MVAKGLARKKFAPSPTMVARQPGWDPGPTRLGFGAAHSPEMKPHRPVVAGVPRLVVAAIPIR